MIYLLVFLLYFSTVPLLLAACGIAKKKNESLTATSGTTSKPTSTRTGVDTPPPPEAAVAAQEKKADKQPESDDKAHDPLVKKANAEGAGQDTPGHTEKPEKEASKSKALKKESDEKPEEKKPEKDNKTVEEKTKYNLTEYLEAPDKTDLTSKPKGFDASVAPTQHLTTKEKAAEAKKDEKKEAGGKPATVPAAGDRKPPVKDAKGALKEEKKEEKSEAKKVEEKVDQSQVESVVGQQPKEEGTKTIDVDVLLETTAKEKEKASGRRSEKRSEKTAKSHCGAASQKTPQHSVVKKAKDRKVGMNDTQCTDRSVFLK